MLKECFNHDIFQGINMKTVNTNSTAYSRDEKRFKTSILFSGGQNQRKAYE